MNSTPNKLMWIGGIGAGFAAVCCFTPIAVIALGVVGSGAAVTWLDSALFPAVFLFAALFVGAWQGGRRRDAACLTPDPSRPRSDNT